MKIFKSQNTNAANKYTPNWGKAFESSRGDYQYVEVEIKGNEPFNFSLDTVAVNPADTTNSLTRLIIRKNKKTDAVDAFLMVVIENRNSATSKNDEMHENTYLNKVHDFTGYVFFYNLNGLFENGWYYKNGKVMGGLKPKQKDKPLFLLKNAPEDYVVYIYEITYHYIAWYGGAGNLLYTTYLGYTVEVIDSYTVYGGGGDGEYAGGGGGGGGDTNESVTVNDTIVKTVMEYTPKPDDKLFKTSFDRNMENK